MQFQFKSNSGTKVAFKKKTLASTTNLQELIISLGHGNHKTFSSWGFWCSPSSGHFPLGGDWRVYPCLPFPGNWNSCSKKQYSWEQSVSDSIKSITIMSPNQLWHEILELRWIMILQQPLPPPKNIIWLAD